MSRVVRLVLFLFICTRGCASKTVEVPPGTDLAPLVGKRVALTGVVTPMQYKEVAAPTGTSNWCLTLSRPTRDQIKLTSPATVEQEGRVLDVIFRPGVEPPQGDRPVTVVGNLKHPPGADRYLITDADWRL